MINDSYFLALIPPLNFDVAGRVRAAMKLRVACRGIWHRVLHSHWLKRGAFRDEGKERNENADHSPESRTDSDRWGRPYPVPVQLHKVR